MNYTINYPASGQIVPPQMSAPVTVPGTGQRTIVLTQSPQSGGNVSNSNNLNGQQSTFPMVMQVGGNNHPVIYTYQNGDVNSALMTNCTDNTTGANGIGQVVLSPVQNSINNSPPGVTSMKLQRESKASAARSLGEVYNMQSLGSVPSNGTIVQSSSVPINQQCQTSDLASLLSSLQAAGMQIVENPCASNNSSNNSAISVPLLSNQMQATETSPDKNVMPNFITSLQSSGFQVVENNQDKTLSISLPNRSLDENSFNVDGKVVPVKVIAGNIQDEKAIVSTGGR